MIDYAAAKIHNSVIRSFPYDHIVIDNFLPINNDSEFYKNILNIKDCDSGDIYDHARNGTKQEHRPGDQLEMQQLLSVFSSKKITDCIQQKFGFTQSLTLDPEFFGGGLTFSPPGSFLRYHTDFNYNTQTNLYRIINAIYYLNLNYQPDFGGFLHLIDPESNTVESIIEPIFNRLVMFKTNLNTPHGVSRNNSNFTRISFNCYYYNNRPLLENETVSHRTNWK